VSAAAGVKQSRFPATKSLRCQDLLGTGFVLKRRACAVRPWSRSFPRLQSSIAV